MNSSFVDVHDLGEDDVVLLSRFGPANLDDTVQRIFKLSGRTAKTHLEFFRAPENPKAYLSVAYMDAARKYGLGIYRYEGNEHKFVAHIKGQVKDPSFFQAPGGDAFIGCRTGTIYRWDGRKLLSVQASQELLEPDSQRFFRRIDFATAPNGPVCCYSIADPRYHKRALYDLLVSDKDGWRRISLAKKDGTRRRTGPGCMPDANTFRMLNYNHWTKVDLLTGSVTEEKFPIPRKGNEKVSPTDVIALPDGTLLSLWRKLYRSPRPNDIDAFENDRYYRIVEWKKDHWEIAPIGLDRQIAKSHPSVVDADGGWWVMSAEDCLVYRSPEGTYRQFDYRHGIPPLVAKRMRLTGKWLWVFGESGELNRFDTARLKQLPNDGVEAPGRLRVYDAQQPMAGFGVPPFHVPPLLGVSGKFIVLDSDGTEKSRIDPPDPSQFNLEHGAYQLHRDSRDNVWVTQGSDRLARHRDGKWEVITEFVDEDGEKWNCLEQTARKLIEEGFGEGDYAPQMAFGSDGRVAVVSDNRVAHFDGKEWHKTTTPDSIARGITFFNDKIVVIRNADNGFRLDRSTNQWQRTNLISNRAQALLAPPKPPIEKPYAFISTNGKALAIGDTQIAIYQRGMWSVTPNMSWPLALVAKYANRNHGRSTWSLRGLAIAEDGTIVALVRVKPLYTYLILPPVPFTVEQGPRQLGVIENPEQILNATWKSSLAANDEVYRFRIDQGPWSGWTDKKPIKPGFLLAKEHQLEVELGSRIGVVRVAPMKYSFELGYDDRARFDRFVTDLGDRRFSVRNKADKQLLQLGRNVRPWLREAGEKTDDPEIRRRIESILQKLPHPARVSD